MGKVQDLTFQESPVFELGSNTFVDVPIVLQYRDKPLIEVSQVEDASYAAQFRIYNKDGVYLAKVRGTNVYRTPEGEKSNLFVRPIGRPASPYGPNLIVCELDGRTIFELRRDGAASLKGTAELFAPDGRFIKVAEEYIVGQPLSVAPHLGFPVGQTFIWVHDLNITGGLIGLHYKDENSMMIAVGGKVWMKEGRPEPPPFRPKSPWFNLRVAGLKDDGTPYDISNISLTFTPDPE